MGPACLRRHVAEPIATHRGASRPIAAHREKIARFEKSDSIDRVGNCRTATQAWSRSLSTSRSPAAEALTAVPVEGDVSGLLAEIDAVVSSEGSTAKDVADAAVALAYVQAKGARR
jgi:hypothetical protein